MALNAQFEIIISRHIGVQKARELSDELDTAYGLGGSLSGRGEQLLGNLLGNAAGRDFKSVADAEGYPAPGSRCESLMAASIGELDAAEIFAFFEFEYADDRRVTQDSDNRVTQSGDRRVLQS